MSGFDIFLLAMAIAAVPVFIALFFIDAGYGKFYNRKWGPCVNNTLGWILMESPVFFAMLGLWWFSGRRDDIVRLTFFLMNIPPKNMMAPMMNLGLVSHPVP